MKVKNLATRVHEQNGAGFCVSLQIDDNERLSIWIDPDRSIHILLDRRDGPHEVEGTLDDAVAEDGDENEGQECLVRLYNAIVKIRPPPWVAIGRVIMEAMQPGGAVQREHLNRFGLRIERHRQPGQAVLLVANRHVALARIFEGTRWRDGTWREALRYLDGVKAWPNAVRFAGTHSRSTAIPFARLPR